MQAKWPSSSEANTRNTDSERRRITTGKYKFTYADASPYANVVDLARGLIEPPALILDLGCGYGAVAEPLRQLGFEYVGCDVDEQAIADLLGRGIEAHALDLLSEDARSRLRTITDGRPVGAVFVLDVIEHLPDPRSLLVALHDLADDLLQPHLVVSVPNVAHFDVGAKLVMGLWDVMPTGLLDETHIKFLSPAWMNVTFPDVGWHEVGRRDFVLPFSDQHFPSDHPALAPGANLHDFLESLRTNVDDTAFVNQFVRAYAAGTPAPAPQQAKVPTPTLSVLLRTQGLRLQSLQEALTCLAAQSFDDYEILLLVHNPRRNTTAEIETLLMTFSERFSREVRLLTVQGGGRSRPLNVGLAEARGAYIAFLDDDDLVTADWLQVFADGADRAEGRVVRSVATVREVERVAGGASRVPYITKSGTTTVYPRRYDALDHLEDNRTPICAYAIPRTLVTHCGLAFAEHLPVLEDWDFLLRAASLAGVHDTEQATSVYHWWVETGSGATESTARRHTHEAWKDARGAIIADLDRFPILLPAGSVRRLTQLVELEHVATDLAAMEGSISWRITRPLRTGKAMSRRAASRLGVGRLLRRYGLRR